MLGRILDLIGYQKKSLANPSKELIELLGGTPAASGIIVNAETALRSPTTLAAVRCISEAVSILPIHMFERAEDGSRKRVREHATARLLSSKANGWTGIGAFKSQLQVDCLLRGEAFAHVIRTAGRPKELHRLPPHAVRTKINDVTSEPQFIVRDKAGNARTLSWRDVIHIQTPGSSVDRCIKLIELAKEAIAIELIVERHEAKLFGNSARPSGVLKSPKMLSPEAFDRLKKSWAGAHGGGEKSGKTAILEDGVEFTPVTFSSVDLQFVELQRLAIERIASVFRTPLTLIGNLDRAVWRNVTELNQQFATMTLSPWLTQWEEALTRVLLTEAEQEKMFLEFQTSALVKADIASRFKAYKEATGGSWQTPNETRKRENMPPIEGGDELVRQAGQEGATDDDPDEREREDEERRRSFRVIS